MLIVAVLVAVFTVGYAFAWFVERKDSDFKLTGASAGAYFDFTSGDGTTPEFGENGKGPFVIANATHMRNLAVLQNTGRFGTDKYYFKIKDTVDVLDMGTLWLPPIGTDDNPFIGEFDGNGKTIANLKVTTDKALLTEKMYPTQAKDSYDKFSQAVGLFGNTGASSNIRNFILNNPHVVVGTPGVNNNKYSTALAKTVGIAVGHVAGKCSSIGVRATDAGKNIADGKGSTTLDVRDTGYSTFNSILGELDEGVQSSVTGGGHVAGSGGSGAAFGASFDVPGLNERLAKIKVNNNSDNHSWKLPTIKGSAGVNLDSLQKIAFTVDSEKSTYDGSDAYEVEANNNIGYLFGNQNKVYQDTFKFIDPLVKTTDSNGNQVWAKSDGKAPSSKNIPRKFYSYTTDRTAEGGYSYNTANSEARYDVNWLEEIDETTLPENVQKLLADIGSEKTYDYVSISQGYTNVGTPYYNVNNDGWSYHGEIGWMGTTYGEGWRSNNAFNSDKNKKELVDINGYRITSDGYRLDENGVLFEPKEETKSYFVNTNFWAFNNLNCSIDEEGYVIKENGDYLLDTNGNAIRDSGYPNVEYEGTQYNMYVVLDSNNEQVLVDMGGWSVPLPAKTGSALAYEDYKNGIFMPNSAIWFKPSQAGKIRFVMFCRSMNDGFALLKIERGGATRNNPLNTNDQGQDITISEALKTKMPNNVLLYYEYDVSEDDIAAGNIEYMLMSYGGVGAHFLYLDLGASAAKDTSTIVPDVVSAVDFIYDGVEIEQEDATIGVGNFIVNVSGEKKLYNASKTSVYFDNLKAILKVVYVRLNEESGKHSGKTICLENSDTTFTTDSEVKATFATYVCPTIGGGSGSVGGGGGTVTPTPDPVPVSSVSITDAPATLTVGGTAKLTANVLPSNATNRAVSWSSSNSNVVSVDSNGNIEAKAAGTATITATAKDGSGKKATATITVTGGAATGTVTTSVDFTSIYNSTDGTADASGRLDIAPGTYQDKFEFSGGKISVDSYNNQTNSFNVTLSGTVSNSITLAGTGASGSGATVSIVVTDASGNEVGRSSQEALSNENVNLTINNLAAGTYTVKVVKTNQSGSGSVKFTEISITESNEGTVTPTPTVSGVTVTPTTATVKKDETTTLFANVTMSDGSAYSGSVVWTSSDTSIATVSNGVVTGVAKGTVTITATAGDKTDTCSVTVEEDTVVIPTPSVTTYEFNSGSKNPTASTGATITLNSGCTKQNGYIKLSNGSGILELTVSDVKAGSKVEINVIDGNNKSNPYKITGDANLNANADGTYTVIANGSIKFTIETTTTDYYFGSATVTVTEP